MNLQESIRRILRENNKIESLVKRRLYFADEYLENLDPDHICLYWKEDEIDSYVRGGMGEITRFMIDSIVEINADDYIEMYDRIYGELINLGYRTKIENLFNESLKNCDPKVKNKFWK